MKIRRMKGEATLFLELGLDFVVYGTLSFQFQTLFRLLATSN